jgi:DNA-binding protein H-NS
VQQLGEQVIATRADSLSGDELAGALTMLAEIKDTARKQAWQKRGAAFFQSGRGELHRQLSATLAALEHNRAARNRQEAAKGAT